MLFQWAVLAWSWGDLVVVLGWYQALRQGLYQHVLKHFRTCWSVKPKINQTHQSKCLWVASELPLSCLWVASESPLSCLWVVSELPLSCLWVASELPLSCFWRSRKQTTRQARHQSKHSNNRETKRKNPKQKTLYKKYATPDRPPPATAMLQQF